MITIEYSTLTEAVSELFIEAYDGPSDPSSTWFNDNKPDCGILGLLKDVTANEASRSVDGSGAAGVNIASHIEHLRWSLANANGALRGQPYQSNWSESWKVKEADEEKWVALRLALRSEYEKLRDIIPQLQDLPRDALLGVMALAPHAAFHLGILRQMLERIRKG
jgi:hypothetical protein